MSVVAALGAAVAALGACHDTPSSPDAHPRDLTAPPPPFCVDGQDGGPAPTLANVEKVLAGNCSIYQCHDADPNGAQVMMDLRPGHVLASTVNVSTWEGDGGSCGVRVKPGDARKSYLYQKMTEDPPCNGSQMPRCELGACPLPDCAIAVVKRWIDDGAKP